MDALVLDASARKATLRRMPKPKPSATEILVRVHAIALNPVDATYTFSPIGQTGRVIGSDFAGTVEAVGCDVPASSKIEPGTKVAGFVQGACSVNERPGAFAEYVAIPWDLVWRVPKEMPLTRAAAVSLTGLTAAQGLFYRLGLPAPFKRAGEDVEKPRPEHVAEPTTVLIYGSSTSVGLYAAQLVRLSGRATGRRFRLIGVASSARRELLAKEPYAYDELVDYRDPDWPAQVRALTGGAGADYALDCISEGASVDGVGKALAANGKMAIYRSRASRAWQAEDLPVEPIYGAVWEGLGVDIQYFAFTVKAPPEARAFATAFYQFLCETADGGAKQLEPNPLRVMPGGLESVAEDGLVLLGPGNMAARDHSRTEPWMRPVSAEKMVYCTAK